MIKRIAMVFVIFALLSFVGCGKAPEMEMQKTSTAIESARTAEAEEYAPDAFQMAMDTLDAANAAKTEADGKFALFRSYGKAKELFARAEALANQAATEAQAEKEQVKAEVTDLLTWAKAILDSADAALKKAPKGKGSKADIELMKNDLVAATTAHGEALADFNAGKYAVAKAKLESAMKKARKVTEEIQKAMAKKTGR
jgi:hypothetical protein